MASVGRFRRATVEGWHAAWGYEEQLTRAYATLLKQASDQAAAMLPRVALAAAGKPKKPTPRWSKPHEAELGSKLRAIYAAEKKTAPIRVEAMRAATGPPLQVIGLNFSLTNPFIRGVLIQAGTKITNIVETTRLDLMSIVDRSWEEGLSIPHTADALRAYGLDNARAALIARTELIGISNGGSIAAAATSQSESLTGGDGLPPLVKLWLTAEDERVRDYDQGDFSHVEAGDTYGEGSGIPLGEPFVVSGEDLMYPGDPSGSAGNVCNCRCAVSYEETGSGLAAAAGRYRGGRRRMATNDTTPAGLPDGAVPIGQAIIEAGEWVACLCIEGMQTSDGRFLALGSIGNRPLPLTLTVQLETAPGHDDACIAGRIESIEKMPVAQALSKGLVPDGRDYPPDAVAVIGYGCFDQDGVGGIEAERLVGERSLRGVSIELAVSEGELVELQPEPGQEMGDLLDVVTLAEIAAACIVAFPAFAEAQIMLATQADAGGLALDAAEAAEEGAEEQGEEAVAASSWRFSVITAAPVQLLAQLAPRRYASQDHSGGSMVAVHPTSEEASAVAQDGGQPAGDLHVTLAHLTKPESTDFDAVHRIVGEVAAAHQSISGSVGGAGYFAAAPPIPADQPEGESTNGKADEVISEDEKKPALTSSLYAPQETPAPPETDAEDTPQEPDESPEDSLPAQAHPHVALVDAPGLTKMRQALCSEFDDAGIDYAQTHDFVPHMTLGYEPTPGVPAVHLAGKPLTFGAVTVHDGPAAQRTEHPMQGGETLTASAAGAAPVTPPVEWFADPELGAPTPMTVTAEGRAYGHLATWGTCHVGIMDACVRPPRNASGYRMFHLGETEVEHSDGSREMLATGVLTMDTGHADLRLNAGATKRHYDDTGVGAIDCVVGEDRHGIWMAGAVRPELSMAAVRRLRASKPSGDWRTVGGAFEMVGVLAVNTPGFPVPRPRARVLAASAGERVTSLVAAGIDLRPSDDSPTRPAELWRLLDRALPGSSAERVEALAASVL